ncbi:MAG: GNAT family N-acetyltransferase [Anaerolineae bacterium]|nr:GNAT family N-acetyltransferase [Anaerolineae bacterium]
MSIDVRVLGEQDAAEFQRVFLMGLTERPEAFTMSVAEQEAQPLNELTQAFAAPNNRFFGAFAGNTLVGIVSLQRYGREKLRHRAVIGSMYVLPSVRGQGIAAQLLERALTETRRWRGLEDVVLAVTVGNDTARRLYVRAGFKPYSRDPRLIKVGDRYFDVEWMICPLNR